MEDLNASNPCRKSFRKICQSRKFSRPLTRQYVQEKITPQMQLSMGMVCECQYPLQHHLHQGGIKDDHFWSTFYRLGLPLEDGTETVATGEDASISPEASGRDIKHSLPFYVFLSSTTVCRSPAQIIKGRKALIQEIQLTPTLPQLPWSESYFVILAVRNLGSGEHYLDRRMGRWMDGQKDGRNSVRAVAGSWIRSLEQIFV